MGATTNQYRRQALHHSEPPPPINARFFYTSPLPIDDPLSPVPPPQAGSVSLKQSAKPFSQYDNEALERSWLDLRNKILKYSEQQAERAPVSVTSRRETGSTVRRDGSIGSSSRMSTSRTRLAAISNARSNSGQAGHLPTDPQPSAEPLDASALNADAANTASTTGMPFVRAPSRNKTTMAHEDERLSRPKIRTQDTYEWDDDSHLAESAPPEGSEVDSADTGPSAAVAVGVSRLHQVNMPDLEMTPIYWTPVHDEAQVVRGTWFYQDTMLPVEPHVAIMLEAGYVDLRCWTDTWKAELDSAVEVGAAGEEKIVHLLWPTRPSKPIDSRPSSRGVSTDGARSLGVAKSNIVSVDVDSPERLREQAVGVARDLIDASTGPGGADNKAAGSPHPSRGSTWRDYASFGVIYANSHEARLLKPSLMPSAYYGRRPLASYIRKGHKLGIRVVRGFDQTAWDRLHPPKTGAKVRKAEKGVATAASGAPPLQRAKTDPDLAKAERPQVTDLVFVIHGIGQKLSKRMESFHFTHAINAFRREVNVEVSSRETQALFRKDMGNIMVLPINWRHLLSFEEGGYRDGPDDPAINEFSLDDITPNTLPSVRNIVSDVMLDIPYYMSHHQSKMISAVIREANRVYQLWCRNNPGFAQQGRVHIIAHSLGSVMAVDILSRQPTTVPAHLADPVNLDLGDEHLDHFVFDTANLFLAGSPAGFFLLLKKAQLLPRLDHPSASAMDDPTTNNISICGERGQYGCLAVENVYNIINPYDPVAYRMNAAVDAVYSASLKQAIIPSAAPGWFGVGTKSSSLFGGSSSRPHQQSGTLLSSSGTGRGLPRLPSNVEMETHNFTREEIAERRMVRLNDNGQIDFFLRYGGGAFDIPYLTMLGAHSSYWLLQDFVRLIVAETGRAGGRDGTFLGLRATKRRKGGLPAQV